MIRGYPSVITVRSGSVAPFHISTTSTHFRLHIYRWGRYVQRMESDNNGITFRGRFLESGEIDHPWNWPTYYVRIPKNWPSGVYIAVLEEQSSSTSGQEYDASLDARSGRCLFIVQNRERSHARLLQVLPTFTYQAYNTADFDGTASTSQGTCLYTGYRTVTLQRPGGGIGGHLWDEVHPDLYDPFSPRQTFAHWDAKAVQWLEEHGYDAEQCADVDLHLGLVDLDRYDAMLFFGHSEYWTEAMRDRVDAFVCGGKSVAFFSGNTCWFRVRYDASLHTITRDGQWDARPEYEMTGVTFGCGGGKWIGERPPTGYTVTDLNHWLFQGCDFNTEATFGAAERLIGYEADGAPKKSALHPAATAHMATWNIADGSGWLSSSAQATMGTVERGRGGIFTASTTDWARVLHAGNPIVGTITKNVLNRFCPAHARYV